MAWAKAPFEDRAPSLQVPVTFVYGENDWMDPEGGKRISKQLAEIHTEKNGTAAPLRPKQNECIIIKDSGHHVYMESPEEFNRIILAIAMA
jgi:cardiolipin-specific phospholipase